MGREHEITSKGALGEDQISYTKIVQSFPKQIEELKQENLVLVAENQEFKRIFGEIANILNAKDVTPKTAAIGKNSGAIAATEPKTRAPRKAREINKNFGEKQIKQSWHNFNFFQRKKGLPNMDFEAWKALKGLD